jgi:hypothetical protein
MDLSEFAQPYLKAPDVVNGPLRKVIAGTEKSKNFGQLEAIFTDHTRLSLCKTNVSTLMKAGFTDTAVLAGLEIELYLGPLPDGNGGTKDGVCVRLPTVVNNKAKMATVSTMPKPAPKKPENGDLDEPIAIGR